MRPDICCCNEVWPPGRLFIGSLDARDAIVSAAPNAAQLGWDLIVNCTTGEGDAQMTSDQRPAVATVNVPVKDNGDPREQLKLLQVLQADTVFQQMDAALRDGRGKGVLVHCLKGQQRSAAVVAAYLMHSRLVGSLEEAIVHVRGSHPMAFFGGYVNFRQALESFALWLCMPVQASADPRYVQG